MMLCDWDTPEGHPGQYCVHLYAFVSYQRLSSQFQFSLSAVTLSQWQGPYPPISYPIVFIYPWLDCLLEK
jgi:hypothetical protein